MSVYAIERRQIDDDHQLILLVPLFQTDILPVKWVVEERLQARELTRFNPVVNNEFIRFFVTKPDGRYVTTGKVNEYISNVCNVFDDSTVRSTAKTITGKLTLANVKSKLSKANDVPQKGLEVLLEYHRKELKTEAHVSLVDSVRRYQYVDKHEEYDADSKPSMHAFMRPIINKAHAPDKCYNNDKRMVEERAEKVRDKERKMTAFQSKVIDEFVARMIPNPNMLHPVELETVYEKQNKPSQRAILDRADNEDSTDVTSQFMKNEAYGEPNDPRIISTINGVDKREWSQFVYQFAEQIMKEQDWYSFGKTPREIAARVASICARAVKSVGITDYSRMDGRHGNLLHELERRAFLRAFRKEYRLPILTQMNKTHHLRSVTVFGYKSKTAFDRLSGVADTSCSNTMDTAFLAYYTYRMGGLDPEFAWDKLGIFGGDDGLTEDVDPLLAERAAGTFGQVLTIDVVKKGELGVTFLSRRYGPDVWYGDENSCCDIKRQLSKFHTTSALPSNIKREQKLQEKAFAFYLTDKNTPIIGTLVKRALELFPMRGDFENKLNIWGVEQDEVKQYDNIAAEWMHDIVNAELAEFDLDKFTDWIKNTTTETIFEAPEFMDKPPAKPKPGIIVTDEDMIVTPEVVSEVSSPSAKNSAGEKDPKHYRGRKPRDKQTTEAAKKVVLIPTRGKARVVRKKPTTG